MKKLKLTALLMAIVLFSGSILSINSYADTISKEAKACEALGILIGSDADSGVTSEYLSTTPSRLTSLIIFLRIKGLEGEALTYNSENNFADANDLKWVVGRNYLAYAKDNPDLGWIGNSEGKFLPNKEIDAKAFYKVMLETLGYKQDLDFTYDDTLKFAESIKLISSASSMSKMTSFTVDDVAKAIYSTLNTKPKGETKRLITLMVEKGILDEKKVVAAGFEIDITPVKVVSFDRISNNRLVLELDQEIPITTDDISIHSENGNKEVNVTDVAMINNKAYITTADVTPFAAYELSINMNTPVNGMAIKNYNVKYVSLPKDTERPKATVEIVSNNIIKIIFNEEVQKSYAEDVSNYLIENDLPVYSAELDSSGKIVTLTTAPQKEGYRYWLSVSNIKDISGNTMEPITGKDFRGMPKDMTKPYVLQAKSESISSVLVKFSEPLNKITAERVENYIVEGNAISIIQAILDEESNTVTLITSEQTPGAAYRMTIRNIADLAGNAMYDVTTSFTGAGSGSSRSTISVVTISSNELEVKFDRKLDKTSAENVENYLIDNDIKVTRAILDGSGKIVTLITEDQTVGKKYRLEINNIQDAYGNNMDYFTTYFSGKAKDTTPLTYKVKSGKNSIIITFNKRVNKETAEDVFNYELDSSLGYAAKATLDMDNTGKTVTLLTKPQESGKVYSIKVNNVTDLSGQAIGTEDKVAKKYFIGYGGSDPGNLNLQAMNALDMSTIDIFFDNELTDEELKNLEISILTEDGKNYDRPKGLEYQKYFSADKSTVRVQFKTDDSNNPELFKAGRIYEVRVSNLDRLNENGEANIKAFAGTNQKNEAPYITNAYAVNSTAVEVTFSEPVRGISPSQFNINGIRITDTSVKTDEITTSATLYLNSSTPLKDDTDYKISVKSGIKDAAGYNSIVTSGSYSYVEFEGTSTKNQAPQLEDVIAIDKYTVMVTFTEPVKLPSASSGFTIKRTTSGGPSIVVSGVVLSDDKKTATVYLNSANGALTSDYDYTMTLSSNITDLQGLALDSDSRKIEFTGSDVELSPFEIMAQSISYDNKVITLIANKPFKNTNINMNCFEISGAYYTKSSSDSIEVYDRTIKINLRNALRKDDVVKIKLTSAGKSSIKDMNNQSLDMDEIELVTNK
ncbi:Ig-like domain-containing protein [Lutispora thermophila]|uniref:Ig-like domain-containing protein n=1 Tax=Lutispora thermophila DSM 19022 TaxID=1122184 RepID=A0A1M6C1T8_9FIRM|nr:Ig-like domain-containing protein [Lutispora thermophila]SHI54668.1 Ig-like domain-containing protein [Lutispora thermophila DSM 19022]